MKQELHKVSSTRAVPNPTKYIQWLLGDYSQWAMDEERVLVYRGQWRAQVFQKPEDAHLDLEIGVGNGYFFAHFTSTNPERSVVGIELKYKPLMQTVRRALNALAKNFRVVRYNAHYIEDLFAKDELNDIYIQFPDPWAGTGQKKHRLVRKSYFEKLHELQRAHAKIEFKTDHAEYYTWVLENIPLEKYKILRQTDNLHQSEWASENFQTHFEKLWTSKGLQTHYILLQRI